jgi:hypothetical protein
MFAVMSARERLSIINATAIVFFLQIVFRVTMLLRRLNY